MESLYYFKFCVVIISCCLKIKKNINCSLRNTTYAVAVICVAQAFGKFFYHHLHRKFVSD